MVYILVTMISGVQMPKSTKALHNLIGNLKDLSTGIFNICCLAAMQPRKKARVFPRTSPLRVGIFCGLCPRLEFRLFGKGGVLRR